MIKWRFFKHILKRNDPTAHDLYCRHIIGRTGGREPRSNKISIDHYIAAAFELARSMNEYGFDSRHPVIVGSNGALKDGAHRIACAIATDTEAVFVFRDKKPGNASAWGRPFLKRCQFSEYEIQSMEETLSELMR